MAANSKTFVPSHVTADTYGRPTIPQHLSDGISWLRGTETLQAWLLLIELGRYRLLSDEQVQADSLLEPVRHLILEGEPAIATDPTDATELRLAAMVARLMPTAVAPHKPGWRLSFPKAFEAFAPPEVDQHAFSILLSLEGYLEIWYTDVLRKAALSPLT